MHRRPIRQRRPRNQGFTLLEVLLVLAILVILGSTVTFYFAKTQGRANARAAKWVTRQSQVRPSNRNRNR